MCQHTKAVSSCGDEISSVRVNVIAFVSGEFVASIAGFAIGVWDMVDEVIWLVDVPTAAFPTFNGLDISRPTSGAIRI